MHEVWVRAGNEIWNGGTEDDGAMEFNFDVRNIHIE